MVVNRALHLAESTASDEDMTLELYQHPELYDAMLPVGAHLPLYLDLAKEHPEGVLELACGTGQLAVPIAAAGVSTFGLDQSAAMLDTARTRAAACGVTVSLVERDMRNFEFGRRFELIFIARNSLLHLLSVQDLVATFAAVRRHLAPGGVFAFDVFTPDVKLLARQAGQRFPVMTVDTAAFGRLVVEGAQHYDAAEQVVRATWYISAAGEPDKWVMPIAVRVIFPQELPLLIEAGGLRLADRFGDLSKQPFGPVSKYQVCLCTAMA